MSLALFSAIMLPGCAVYNRDLSNQGPYSEFSGKVVTLKKEMALVEARGTGYYPYSSILLVAPNKWTEPNGWSWDKRWTQIKSLSEGTRLRIVSFHWVNGLDSAWVIVVGETLKEGIRFEHRLGHYGWPLHEPPWEGGENWPSKYIGWEGEVTNEDPSANIGLEQTR